MSKVMPGAVIGESTRQAQFEWQREEPVDLAHPYEDCSKTAQQLVDRSIRVASYKSIDMRIAG